MEHTDILVIGGGAAGIAAAKAASDLNCQVTLVDRKPKLGGILLQCTHAGFGKDLTGPQYIRKLLKVFPPEVKTVLRTTVLSISADKVAYLSGGKVLSFSQLILASGCWEIPLGALPIGGTRPAGIYTAGQMQEMINLYDYIPEGPVVILGSGDIGLIMAIQIAALGLPVTIVEQKNKCGGMARNQRWLQQYPVRLICGQTIDHVTGMPNLENCHLSGGESLSCKTLLIAAGLRPERTLISNLQNPVWLHLCGNCSTIHPMVEGVIIEGTKAGIIAAQNIRGEI